MTEPELFDSEPYYVAPPPPKPVKPVKLRVSLYLQSHKSDILILTGTALDLYKTCEETGDPEDEQAFMDWILDDILEQHLLDISIETWEEVT